MFLNLFLNQSVHFESHYHHTTTRYYFKYDVEAGDSRIVCRKEAKVRLLLNVSFKRATVFYYFTIFTHIKSIDIWID